MADGIYITDNLHGYEDVSRPVMPQPLKNPGPVTIEDEVWLGENVCVLPNVTIGKHSVVGSNSVVTKDIPPYSVAVGTPARVIKTYSPES
jgi:acetyltransferase-like isoleucine patch superfamily enzyme